LDIVSDQTTLLLLRTVEPAIVTSFWNRDEDRARVVVQLNHVPGQDRLVHLIKRVEEISKQRFPSSRVAGYYVLLANVVESLLADQWKTFALSIAAIFLIMSLAFRSFSLGLAAMVPNAAPILMVIGLMGWLGLDINIATAMMASVSMGLSVDFSIHYLYRFQRELQSGKDFFTALRSTHGSVGLAMVVANLALVAGFLALTLSSLVPSIHFGILVSVAMLGGLIGNLIVLPLILYLLLRLNLISVAATTSDPTVSVTP
jgi:predicted RND superfamily exporter protein